MSSPNARKGADTERDVTNFLQEVFGRAAFRPHQEGFNDVGDIHLSPFALQCKNYANVAAALNLGVDGANKQKVHAEEPFGAAVIKKRGKGIADARVAMDLRTFRDVVARMRLAESLLARHAPEIFHEQFLRADLSVTADVLVTEADQAPASETEHKTESELDPDDADPQHPQPEEHPAARP